MNGLQTLVAIMFLVLVALSIHEYWKPQLNAIMG